MITESEGYQSLIEFLTEHLALFSPGPEAKPEETNIREFIETEMGNHLLKLFDQHEDIDLKLRFQIIEEADLVVADLLEVLSNRQNQAINQKQQQFLSDFIGLVKNMFDAQIHS